MRSRQCAPPLATSQRRRRPSAGGWKSFAVSCGRLPDYSHCSETVHKQQDYSGYITLADCMVHDLSRTCSKAPSGRLHVAHHDHDISSTIYEDYRVMINMK